MSKTTTQEPKMDNWIIVKQFRNRNATGDARRIIVRNSLSYEERIIRHSDAERYDVAPSNSYRQVGSTSWDLSRS